MASYHCTVKVGGKGKACAHSSYIAREGKYSKRERYEDLEATAYGNMPKWAEHNTEHFWNAADEYERVNGATYREIEIALPRELTPEQRRELVEDFIAQEIGNKHAYQWAIHTPKAALEKGEQPHAHIMYSERMCDGIDRDPAQYFKRYNAKAPEKGGCRKDSAGTNERLQATRQRWADVQNSHLERHGHAVRVDHRSLKEQGISRLPEKHIGPSRVKDMPAQDVAALLTRRDAEGELEQAQKQVISLIDVSSDLDAAKAEHDSQPMPEPEPAPTIEVIDAGFDRVQALRRRLAELKDYAVKMVECSQFHQANQMFKEFEEVATSLVNITKDTKDYHREINECKNAIEAEKNRQIEIFFEQDMEDSAVELELLIDNNDSNNPRIFLRNGDIDEKINMDVLHQLHHFNLMDMGDIQEIVATSEEIKAIWKALKENFSCTETFGTAAPREPEPDPVQEPVKPLYIPRSPGW